MSKYSKKSKNSPANISYDKRQDSEYRLRYRGELKKGNIEIEEMNKKEMKFHITRASDLHQKGEYKPCENAFKEEGIWYIEINSFDDLMDLVEEVGQIIIRKGWITIYDDYVE